MESCVVRPSNAIGSGGAVKGKKLSIGRNPFVTKNKMEQAAMFDVQGQSGHGFSGGQAR